MVMQYRHQVVTTRADVDSEQPRLCLTFSKHLPEQDPNLFARYVAIDPPIKAAFDAKEGTLCISGVSFSQSYKVTVRRADGSDDGHGPWVQVSRLGNPLINEVIVPTVAKNTFIGPGTGAR